MYWTKSTGMDELETLLEEVVEQNQAYYTQMLDLAHVTAVRWAGRTTRRGRARSTAGRQSRKPLSAITLILRKPAAMAA